jgi:NDP-sugar pyrophosphorylase family protein
MIDKTLIVLAGGFGTRLQSILKGKPKPMADINGTPFIYFLFENWVKCGFTDFVLSLHFQANEIIEYTNSLKSSILKDSKIRYVIENEPLGTGGAISNVISKLQITEFFFVANADTWLENGYEEIDQQNKNTLAIVKIDNGNRFGKILLNENGLIEKFVEKNNIHEESLINAGVYKLSKNIFTNWNGEAYSLENDLFPILVTDKRLNGKILISNFIDIGIPEDYYKFCKNKESNK